MIEFQVLSGPDEDVLSAFKYFQNQIYIGRSAGNLTINDPELERIHVMIEVIENDLIIHPQKNVNHFLINGKRAATVRKLKIQETVTIGKTQIKILAFEMTPVESKKTVLSRKLAELSERNSSRIPVIEQLSKLSK